MFMVERSLYVGSCHVHVFKLNGVVATSTCREWERPFKPHALFFSFQAPRSVLFLISVVSIVLVPPLFLNLLSVVCVVDLFLFRADDVGVCVILLFCFAFLFSTVCTIVSFLPLFC